MMYWSDRDIRWFVLITEIQVIMVQAGVTWLYPPLQRGEDVVEQDGRHGVVDRHLDSASGAELWTDHAAHIRQPTPP